MQPRPPASAYAAAVAMPFAFGMSFVATKYALRGFEPLLVALLRFTLAGVILWVLLRLRREREPVTRRDLGRLALMGFVSLTVYFSFENTGIARTSASQAAILIATIPIFVAVLNVFTLREPMAARQWTGVVLSFAGIVALVSFGGQSSGGSVGGDLLVLAASLSAAVYSIMARSLLLERSALSVTAYQNLFGAAFMLPLALLEAALVGVRRPTADAVGGVLFLTVMCSVIAYLLLNYAFRFIEASRLSVFINLTPIVGVGFAFLVLGERFTGGQAAAAVVVVLGVWLTNTGSREAARSPSAG